MRPGYPTAQLAIIRASLHDFLPPAPAVWRLARAVRERVRPRPIDWPVKSREIVQFTLDSTLWNDFRFRDDDIVIATWSKSGTTLTQQIVAQLIFGGRDRFGIVHSPWIESRIVPGARELADQQQHRRFLKTHLPIDALVFSPQAKYIYIGRDARDVCWSWYGQLANWNESAYELINRLPGRDGPPFGPPDPDIRRFYHDWLDNDAYPSVPFWSHVQGWWNIRNLPNVLLLHFSELTSDLPRQMCRIARFLEIRISRREILPDGRALRP